MATGIDAGIDAGTSPGVETDPDVGTSSDGGPALEILTVGHVGRPFGVRGWVHVHSAMEPPGVLAQQSVWRIAKMDRAGVGGPRFKSGTERELPPQPWTRHRVHEARGHGQGIVARIDGCRSREDAEEYRGCAIGLPRAELPAPAADEYYWMDLIGAAVVTQAGVPLGSVKGFMETGANDVMVVDGERERLIPFLLNATVSEVDLIRKRLVVDWDPDF